MANIAQPSSFKMFDGVIEEFRSKLAGKLTWINNAYGRAYRLSRIANQKEYVYPAIHLGNEQYLSVEPSTSHGNYLFFDVNPVSEIEWHRHSVSVIKGTIGLVVYGNLNVIYPNETARTVEFVKLAILKALASIPVEKSQFIPKSISERWVDAFEGFTLEEVVSQYLMQPYFVLRFEIDVKFNEPCV